MTQPSLSGGERAVVDAMRRGEVYYHEIDFEALKTENARLREALRSIGANGGPLYLLEPSQGERPDPLRAAQELRRIIVEALA